MQDNFYTNFLYPLQDSVLIKLLGANTDFYLTGGTALSRFYLNHRYSDDLDFFVNHVPDFQQQTNRCISLLEKSGLTLKKELYTSDFVRLFVIENGVPLKIEFINDVLFHFDGFMTSSLGFKIDSWQNILSNKISALQRNAEKDIADLLIICTKFEFDWVQMINAAKDKDSWVDEIEVSRIINNFDVQRLDVVKWIAKPNTNWCADTLKIISEDVLLGRSNRIVNKG